jgi:hypothetical protein
MKTGVGHAGLVDPLDDAARHRADVGPAVAADLRLVPDAAERQPDEFAAERVAIDRPSEVFPTPGGPTKQRIGPLSVFFSAWTARYSRILSLTFSMS